MTHKEYLSLRKKAFKLLWETSKDKVRWSSPIHNQQPYWTHPLHVYLDMVKEGVTYYPALLAAILHDIVEDTPITLEIIERYFGFEVKEIVDLASKSERFNDTNLKEFYNRVAESNNVWSMYIKVFDRIDNLLTYASFDKDLEQTKRFIDETKEFFIPLARKVGLENKLLNALRYAQLYYQEKMNLK